MRPDESSATVTPEGPTKNAAIRRVALSLLAAAVVLCGAGTAAWWWLQARWTQSTDDAYVAGNLVQLMSQVPGTVVRIAADDTATVQAGQVLVELDRRDAVLDLEAAQAALGAAVRQVRQLHQSQAQARAQWEVRKTELDRAEHDLARRVAAGPEAVGAEEVQHARSAVQVAQAAVEAARQDYDRARSAVDGTSIESHPSVVQAAARLRQAHLALRRTAVLAPVGGAVARRSVQLGQRVQPGMPLLAIVPTDELWIEANFKESQLADLRAGQPATLTADLYGGRVTYQGRVVGLGAGTGAAFALLPAQNATGNWIKVVQRVPVRIALDPAQVREHPLRVGLSASVQVNTRERSGRLLAAGAPPPPGQATAAYADVDADVDTLVSAILRANLGPVARHPEWRAVAARP